MKIILASTSPRRNELLRKIIGSFEIKNSKVDEKIDQRKSAAANTEFLAVKKARAVFERKSVTNGGDTLGEIDGKILGKPKSKKEAKEFLRKLSGKKHLIVSAFCIKTDEREITGRDETFVEFCELSDVEIKKYSAENPVEDFAAGYAIQNLPKKFIKKIDGSIETVIGFPSEKIRKILHDLRVD